MNLWKKIKDFITKPYMKKEKKKDVMINDLQYKTKKELESIGRKLGIELDRRLTKQKLINKIKFKARNRNR
tara:strand:+ start:122 stop:334 length:213 start_codon:yes stop_codon:yes gene_type:complete